MRELTPVSLSLLVLHCYEAEAGAGAGSIGDGLGHANVATTAIHDVKQNMAVNFFDHIAYTIILRPTVTCC
ncbi:hypothetical protein NC653_003066 [Populus alba x Populus x berolinensis]|uniref:Secreted protein n=1 Tax=Populus alba x Populus x berolinensis TaxID=444605 RepID=A0AAD6RQN3_9ROSI|nr:hypothetical protein NC653_003066 [Populus alba x Populus x berolinensis]